jgi:xanthosine utilization system XapX-like protein
MSGRVGLQVRIPSPPEAFVLGIPGVKVSPQGAKVFRRIHALVLLPERPIVRKTRNDPSDQVVDCGS